jgi:hypothetical protein
VFSYQLYFIVVHRCSSFGERATSLSGKESRGEKH